MERSHPSEERQGGAAQRQNEMPHQERRQEPIVAASTAATPFSVPAEQNHLPHEPKDTLIDLEAVRRKLREEQGKRQGTGTASEQNVPSGPKVWGRQGGDADLPPGKMKVVLDKYTYALIDTPEEKARKRARIPQEEQQRLTDVIQAYGTRPLTEDEWQVVERSRYLDEFFDALEPAGRGKVGYKQELLEKEMNEHFGKMLKERMTDRYPDWWKVYDKDGNRVWKMSLMDKALLAKWRRFDGLPADMKWEILRREYEAMRSGKDEHLADTIREGFEVIKEILIACAEAMRTLMLPPETETQ